MSSTKEIPIAALYGSSSLLEAALGFELWESIPGYGAVWTNTDSYHR